MKVVVVLAFELMVVYVDLLVVVVVFPVVVNMVVEIFAARDASQVIPDGNSDEPAATLIMHDSAMSNPGGETIKSPPPSGMVLIVRTCKVKVVSICSTSLVYDTKASCSVCTKDACDTPASCRLLISPESQSPTSTKKELEEVVDTMSGTRIAVMKP